MAEAKLASSSSMCRACTHTHTHTHTCDVTHQWGGSAYVFNCLLFQQVHLVLKVLLCEERSNTPGSSNPKHALFEINTALCVCVCVCVCAFACELATHTTPSAKHRIAACIPIHRFYPFALMEVSTIICNNY